MISSSEIGAETITTRDKLISSLHIPQYKLVCGGKLSRWGSWDEVCTKWDCFRSV